MEDLLAEQSTSQILDTLRLRPYAMGLNDR